MLIRRNNTNNISEATMRVLKDKIFGRECAHNLIQLCNFISTRIDSHSERRLIDICAGMNIRTLVKNCFQNVDEEKIQGLVVNQLFPDSSVC